MEWMSVDPQYHHQKCHYRYVLKVCSGGYFDENGDFCSSSFYEGHIKLEVWREVKTTPKGVWIERAYGNKKFVLNYGRKRYAWPSKEEAWESFLARKRKQAQILRRQLVAAERALEMSMPPEPANSSKFAFTPTWYKLEQTSKPFYVEANECT
jgi:hypothetical protein